MSPRKPRHFVYALSLVLVSLVFSAVGAKSAIYTFVSDVRSALTLIDQEALDENKVDAAQALSSQFVPTRGAGKGGAEMAPAMMFASIITNADTYENCNNDSSTMASYNLCGDFDNRQVTLQGSYSSYEWQRFAPGGGCAFNVDDVCANATLSCWTTVSTGSSFNINASSINSSTGAGFRVRVNGTGAYHYFNVKKSKITQTVVTRDFICGTPGRIQVTNLSSDYEYNIDKGSGFGDWQGAIFNNLQPGPYVVKARLKNTPNSCEYLYDPIMIEEKNIDIEVTFTDAKCFEDTGKIGVVVKNVPGPYKYSLIDAGGIAQEFTTFIPSDTYEFRAVGFGTYSIRVETQQCKGDLIFGIPPPTQNLDINGNPIIIGAGITALSASTEVNSSFGCGVPSVDVQLRTSGGMAPYTYQVNGTGPVSAPYTSHIIHTATLRGSYNFVITDSNGCVITASASVEELTPPDITVAGVDGTCTNGGAKLNFTVVNAKGYNLSYRSDPGDAWSTNPQLTVPAGTYTNIQVRYQQGGFECILDLPGSVTVATVGTISGNAVKVADRTCDGAGGITGGVIEFQGPFSGGSGSGYVFSISGDAPGNFTTQTTYPNLAAGIYTPIIRDDSGCRLELNPIKIENIDPPTAIDFAQSNMNCAAGTADVSLTVTATHAIVKYEIVSPAALALDNGASPIFTGLNIATPYQFRVTDSNGCSYTSSFTPANISTIRARVKSGGDFRVCTGAPDGTGTFLIDGFANTYTYSINGGPASLPRNGNEVLLPPSGAGTYTITVTDTDTGCTGNATITIENPPAPIALSRTVTNMSCANNNIGRVVGTATGGWGGYQYTLTPPTGPVQGPRSNGTFGNLGQPGKYILSVTDAEGCTTSIDFDLTPIAAPDLILDEAASNFCYVPGTGATLVVTSTAGTAPLSTHQYRINGGAWQSNPVFPGLAAGKHTITVRDANNCSKSITVTINARILVTPTIETEIPCGGQPGEIRIQVSGGYRTGAGSKSYAISSDGGTTFGSPNPLTSDNFLVPITAGGTYVFRITDNKGCTVESSPFIMAPPDVINASHEVIDASCGQTNNGIITIIPDATIGVPPYQINFDGRGFSDQTTFSNLVAGQTYGYEVRDSRGCLYVGSAPIGANTTPAPDATVVPVEAVCSANIVSGEIQVTNVSDGTPNFTYILQNRLGAEVDRIGPTANTNISFTDLQPGNYTVITIDSVGCRDIDQVTIVQNTVSIVPDPVTALNCAVGGFTNTVEIVGGTGPFQIRLVAVPAHAFETPNQSPRRHTFNGLQYGVTYTVEILDEGTGCTYTEVIDPVTGPSPLNVTLSSTPGYCDVARNGQISYTISGFTGGDLIIELVDMETGTRTTIGTPSGITGSPYTGTYEALPGEYQIIVTDPINFCTAADLVTIDQNLPVIDIIAERPANCNAAGSITVLGSGGAGGPYEYAYMPRGGVPTNGNFTSETTYFAPAGDYDVYVRDINGCTSFAIATVINIDPVLPVPTINVVNQCTVTATSFQIRATMPATINTPRFTLGGETKMGVLNGAVYEADFTVNSPGSYPIDVVDGNGCTSQGTAEVYEFLSVSGNFSTAPNCTAADGIITIEVTGGSNQFSFQLMDEYGGNLGAPIVGDRNAGIFINNAPGKYEVYIEDTETGCNDTVPITLEAPILPIISDVEKQDISCFGVQDGSIHIVLQSGTDANSPIEYKLLDFATRAELASNNTGSFGNLGKGSYEVEVITARNCRVLSGLIEIIEPPQFRISALAPDFVCEVGANRYSATTITVAIEDPGTLGAGYQYSITGFGNYQTSNTFEIIDNGTIQNITVYAIDGNGCEAFFVLPPINPPTEVVPTLTFLSALDCRDPERVRISVVGTTHFTINVNSVVPIAPVTVNGSSSEVLELPAAGDYLFEIIDHIGGCIYPMPKHTVHAPVSPTVVIEEAKPVQCYGVNDGALRINVSTYTGAYTYTVYRSDDLTASTPIKTGTLDTSTNPELITDLPGGNFYVRVEAQGMPYCTTDSNVATIRTPNGLLEVEALEVGNVSCDDNTGQIVATATGGWDKMPYVYALLKESSAGSGAFVEVVSFDTGHEFKDLSSGNYRVVVRDVEGCEDTFDIPLGSIPPIVAEIREPQGLVCPGGNNAILEVYNPVSGLVGAGGGVAGAGYKYQLIYLNSNDINDVRESGGLQDQAVFVGATGGYISAGWYAIAVFSSYACKGITQPYFVNPPPAIVPKLVQVKAPGCGDFGQMLLSIENPEIGFEYEYRAHDAAPGEGYTPMIGTEVYLDRDLGYYQYDVRKLDISGANVCDPVRSPGVSLVDATRVELVANLPDDISCASETDGRIESFAAGGVGSYKFTLYRGDPGDAFAPTAPIERSAQNDGTFEGLPEGVYYIGVTSGRSCGDVIGPLTIIRPAPIAYQADPEPVSCNGETDGSITVAVTSGGVGLVQFAISPNFNKFFNDPNNPNTYTFIDLAPGTYEILIQDEKGCSEKVTRRVEEPEALTTSFTSTVETCIDASDGSAQVFVQGGTPFVDALSGVRYYEAKILGPDATGDEEFERNDALFLDNLSGGESYVVFIRDAKGCETNVVIPIQIGVDLQAEALVDYGCEGIFPNSTVTISMADRDLMPQLLFSLNVDNLALANTRTVFGNLPAGNHTVYIYHENGCATSVTFAVEAYQPLMLVAIKSGPNEVTATASGGFGEYEYYFQGEPYGYNNVFLSNRDTQVTVRVVDRMGCETSLSIPFKFTGKLNIPNFFTPNGDNFNDKWFPGNREFFPNIEVKIYDRYGRVVAILDQVSGWDGTYEGKELPTGDYWYEVNANDEAKQRFMGHFTLYR